MVEKDDWKLGAYHCPKCNADTVDSFVLVDYYENGCRIVAKKIKAYDLFNRKYSQFTIKEIQPIS